MMLSGITGSYRGLTQFPVSKQAGGCLMGLLDQEILFQ